MDIKYGEEELEILADEEPEMFLSVLKKNNLSVATISFALEILGKKFPEDTSIAYLDMFSNHTHPLVREGCLLGLSHCGSVAAKEIVISLTDDTVPEVATIAKRVLTIV